MESINDQMQAILEKLQKKSQCLSDSERTALTQSNKEYLCNICKDAGGSMVAKKAGEKTFYKDIDGSIKETTLRYDTEEWKECECVEIRKVNRLIKSSEITEEFQKMGFKNFDVNMVSDPVKDMRDIALNYYKCFDDIRSTRVNSCLFIGQSGCGKTHLLTAVSNGLMRERQIPVLYFPFLDGMGNISANDWERKADIIQKMKDVEVLFIDDLFKPVGKTIKVIKWQADIIIEVLNHRYLNHMPMLVSTELSLTDLLDIDEAMGSRMFEMASDFTKTIDKDMGNNWRLRKLRGA